MVSAGEYELLASHTNVPVVMLLRQGQDLRLLRDDEAIDMCQFVRLEGTWMSLTNSMGDGERIRNTSFPPLYANWTQYLIHLFIVLLPLSLVNISALAIVLVSLPIALGFLIIDSVAEPFGNPILRLSGRNASADDLSDD